MSRPIPGAAPDSGGNSRPSRRGAFPLDAHSPDDFDADVDFPAFPSPSQLAARRPRRSASSHPQSLRAASSGVVVSGAVVPSDPFFPSVDEAPWLSEAAGDEVETATRAPRRAASPRATTKPANRAASHTAERPARGAQSTLPERSRSDRASSSKRQSKERSTSHRLPPKGLLFEVGGVLCLALGLLLFWNAMSATPEGLVPRASIFALRWMFGVGAVVVPLLLMTLGGTLVLRRQHTNLRAFGRGVAIALLVLLTGVHLNVASGREFQSEALLSHGGAIGGALAWLLRRAVGEAGAVIALVAFSIVALLFLTEISLTELASNAGNWFGAKAQSARHRVRQSGDAWRAELENEEFDASDDEQHDEQHDKQAEPEKPHRLRSRRPQIVASVVTRALPPEILEDAAAASPETAPRRSPFLALEEIAPPTSEEPATTAQPTSEAQSPAGPRIEILNTPPPVSVVDAVPDSEPSTIAPAIEAKVLSGEFTAPSNEEELTPNQALEAQALATAGTGEAPRPPRPQRIRRHFGDGPLMPEYFDDVVRALDPPILPDTAGVADDIAQDVQAVQDTLQAFKIDARVTDVKRGPVITRYEVQPAPGVRVAAIANLDRDMARSLSAIAVRIEAPVPGKNVVGIEVPNRRVHLVRLRDVLELPEFLSAPSKLAFVLGKDIAGQPKWADLTKMPHMLVAGATNSGKSVCLNTIISSIITRATPEEVKFSLIDPKRVELTLYRDIPHLYHPVVVEPKDAVKVLRGMIVEMDRRYKKFAERGVRNIVSFNAKLEPDEAPLPYIVIVIDELADLMMTAAAEFEKLICRLAQLARATGIHLIVATQRPSVNVITGVIKANIPARVAFAVASQVDSRTILDAVGAERLIGSGDMLFDANNGGKAVRIQGAYLSEEEVNRIVEVVKEHYIYEPREYGLDLNAFDEDEEADEKPARSDDRRDDLYDEIKEFVVRHQEMSASMIQRKYEIGYPRAARIVDQFERDGILGPADGPKPRKVVGPGRD